MIHDGTGRRRILAICTLDVMAWNLLLPWFLGLLEAGFEVHIACQRSKWFEQLSAYGFHVHDVPLRRRMNPLVHIAPLWKLYRLMRRERFGLVNAHSPVAAAVGRLAGWLARIPLVIYTVHGFYFHDDMPHWSRRGYIALEWLLGRITTRFMFVSDEDRHTALREGIATDAARTATIFNGVDLEKYSPGHSELASDLRRKLNIPRDAPVVGIVGRVVKEKGYIEFAEMAKLISAEFKEVCFLVVGDALPSDRDGIVAELHTCVADAGLDDRFRFTGFTDGVAGYLLLMNVFVLPSYREGFPRSVLEAMSSALPVVATNIRGCREAVVHGETGLLVPTRNGAALAEAVARLLRDRDLAVRFGSAGRERAVRLYDQRLVQRRFVDFIEDAFLPEKGTTAYALPRILKRAFDLMGATAGVVLLFPMMILAWVAIRIGLGGSTLFKQRRVGLGGREFMLYKFRTMSEECDLAGGLLPDEQRLNRLGSWLRRTSLDELPQLINVLRGELSLVGPRPLLPVYLNRYSEVQRRRHDVKPGLTGWAQIHGRNAITWSRRFELDIWYVDHWGLWLDMKIVCRTIGQLLWWKENSREGHATMPEFLGTEKK